MDPKVTISIRSDYRGSNGQRSAISVCGHESIELGDDVRSSAHAEGRLSLGPRIERLLVPLACRPTGTSKMPGCQTQGREASMAQRSLLETARTPAGGPQGSSRQQMRPGSGPPVIVSPCASRTQQLSFSAVTGGAETQGALCRRLQATAASLQDSTAADTLDSQHADTAQLKRSP